MKRNGETVEYQVTLNIPDLREKINKTCANRPVSCVNGEKPSDFGSVKETVYHCVAALGRGACPLSLAPLAKAGLRRPASASLPLASCWPLPQQLLPVSATGARVAFAAFSSTPWRGLEKAERCPSLASLHLPLAAVGSATVVAVAPKGGASGETVHFAGTAKASPR